MTNIPECLPPLMRAGISLDDATVLRRIAMQLHRWHEKECGSESGGVERDEETGRTYWYSSATGRRTPCPDLETPALKRLAKIMERYPQLGYYVQTDPRGAALYILPPGTVPQGENVNAYYSRGLAVYR